MRKNLIVLHLDCLSQTVFRNFQTDLPNIARLANESIYFVNCYSPGSSSEFAMMGVAQGSVCGVDHIPGRSDVVVVGDVKSKRHETDLFTMLRDRYGYATKGFILADWVTPTAMAVFNEFLPALAAPTLLSPRRGYGDSCGGDPDPLETAFRAVGTSKRPFAFFIHNLYEIYHRGVAGAGNPDSVEMHDSDIVDLYGKCFRDFDDGVGHVLARLAEFGYPDQTLIVAFGDHGRSYLNRMYSEAGREEGTYTTASDNLVPLFIRNGSDNRGVSNALVSLEDMRATILGQLFPDEVPSASLSPFPGVDIFREKRELVYSQNKYALQNDREDAPGVTRKSYAVTDGKVRLIVSAVSNELRQGGMELYFDRLDPSNHANLLDLFVLNGEGDVVDYTGQVSVRRGSEYQFIFSPLNVCELGRRYQRLRELLRRYVDAKERAALTLPFPGQCRFPMESFCLSAASWLNRGWPPLPSKGMRYLGSRGAPIALFGAGPFGREVHRVFRHHGLAVVAFVDNRIQGVVDDLRVYSVRETAMRYPKCIVVGCARGNAVDAMMEEESLLAGLEYCSYNRDVRGSVYRRGNCHNEL